MDLKKQFQGAQVQDSKGEKVYTAFYQKNPKFSLKRPPRWVDYKDYEKLFHVYADNLDQVYSHFQGEVWSPNGEARNLIRSLKLNHTSMSIGDLIQDHSKNKWYIVAPVGFKEIYMSFSETTDTEGEI